MSTYTEALALMESLPEKGSVSWEIGKVYNALLSAGKEAQPDSISLGALEPLEKSVASSIAHVHAADLRAMLAIVAAALKPAPMVG